MYLNDLVSFEFYSAGVHLNQLLNNRESSLYSVKYVNIGIYFAVFQERRRQVKTLKLQE